MTPVDPFGSMAASAISLHEIYSALVEAGFEEDQAVYLVGVMLQSTMANEARS